MGNESFLACLFSPGLYKIISPSKVSISPNYSHPFLVFSDIMDIHWIPPPNGVKINVHGESFPAPLPNGNMNGIGVVLRTSDGNLVNSITGIIPNLSSLAN